MPHVTLNGDYAARALRVLGRDTVPILEPAPRMVDFLKDDRYGVLVYDLALRELSEAELAKIVLDIAKRDGRMTDEVSADVARRGIVIPAEACTLLPWGQAARGAKAWLYA